MNILMVCIKFPPHFGGAAVQAVRLAEALKNRGLSIEFFTDNGPRRTVVDFYKNLKVHRVRTFVHNDQSKLRELIYVMRLLWFILRHPEFKIIHFHSLRGFEALIYPLLRTLGRKVVLKLTLIDNDDPMTFKRRKRIAAFYMWGLKRVTHFVAISKRLRDSALEAGMEAEKISIIYNGVDTTNFDKISDMEKGKRKNVLGYGQFENVFLSVGSIEHRKGYDLLLAAWRLIESALPSSVLLVAGPGNENTNLYYRELCAFIERYNLTNVFFLGKINNVDDYMKISDCFLFCSRAEGFGTVLIEAMSACVPVVAANIPGVTEDIVKDTNIGRICYSQNPEDFSRMVVDFYRQRDKNMMEMSAKRVRQEFSIEQIADQYVELYQTI